MLVDATTPLGPYYVYSLAPRARLDYLKRNAPKEINYFKLLKTFKKDVFVDVILEKLEDVDVFYIETSEGRGDELYYFKSGAKIFHGEKVWSSYHDFFPHLAQIKPSSTISCLCWFVGSRSNYTHQLIDFIPSLLFQNELDKQLLTHPVVNVYGKPNSILDSLMEVPLLRQSFNGPKLFLEALGSPEMVGSWKIRCIRFRQLYLVKHMSIFKAFSLVGNAFASLGQKNILAERSRAQGLLYLCRGDQRVVNQDEIKSFLNLRPDAATLENIHQLSYSDKFQIISAFRRILLPPGSDNINGLCFSAQEALLFQMISVPIAKLLDSPFYSYAGLRYLLPFLHRLTFLPSADLLQNHTPNAGKWDVGEIERCLNQ